MLKTEIINKYVKSKTDSLKNSTNLLESKKDSFGNVLILNESENINIVRLFKDNKLLTIEVINDIVNNLLNKEITFDFFIKIIMKIEINERFNKESNMIKSYTSYYSLWENRFKRSIKKPIDFDGKFLLSDFLRMFDKVIAYETNYIDYNESQNIYKEFSNYIGEYLNNFVNEYKNNNVLNSEINYANILFNSKDIKLDEFPEIFKQLRKFFLDPDKDNFTPNVKYENSSLYGLDIYYGNDTITEICDYLLKYPNINKIKYLDEQFSIKKNENILKDLDLKAFHELEYKDYLKFRDRNITISALGTQFNILFLNKENLFIGVLSKLAQKLDNEDNNLSNIENIYVPQKEIKYSNIKHDFTSLRENLIISKLLDSSDTDEFPGMGTGNRRSIDTLERYLYDNWNNKDGKRNIISGSKDKVDFSVNVIPFSEISTPLINEDEYSNFSYSRGDNPRIVEIESGETRLIGIKKTKIDVIDIDIVNKAFIDLMSIMRSKNDEHLFSLKENDMTQKNIIWYIFSNIFKNEKKIQFKNINTINFLNIILQKFSSKFDFLDKDKFNGIDYYNLMVETYKSDKVLKDIIEFIVLKSYLGKALTNINTENILENINKEKSKLTIEEIKIIEKVFNDVYEVSMNDILLFQQNDISINNYFESIYILSKKNMIKVIKNEGLKDLTNFTEDSNDFIINNEISHKFNIELSNLFKWYELNIKLLYDVSSKEINDYFLSIVNNEDSDIDMLNYNNGKLQKYDNIDELKLQVQRILNDNEFQEYLKFGKGYILSEENIYHLDVKKEQFEISLGEKTDFSSEFKKLDMQGRKEVVKDIMDINQIYSNDTNETQKEILGSLPVSDYYTKVLNYFKETPELYSSISEIITIFMQEKEKELDVTEDILNNFVYYFNKIYADIYKLQSEGRIKIEDIQKSEKFLVEMMEGMIKGEEVEFEKIYFKYYSTITLYNPKIIINKEDLKYLNKFEDEILPELQSYSYTRIDIIDYIENSILLIKKNLEGKNNNKFTFGDNDGFENNNSLVRPFLFYKIISDYINIQKRFDNEVIIKTSIIMGQISEVINKKEYVKTLLKVFRSTKPLFTSLNNKIKDKELVSGNMSSLLFTSIQENIKISKDRIIQRYVFEVEYVINNNFDRIEDFIKSSNIVNGKTVFDLITSKLEAEFIKIKDNKKFYNISNKAFFINTNEDNIDVDKTIVLNVLRNISEKYKINILFGKYKSENIDSKTAGHFILKQENVVSINISNTIFYPGFNGKEMVIVNNVNEEARSLLKCENTVIIGKVSYNDSDLNNDWTKISYMNYQADRPLNIVDIKTLVNLNT